VWISARLDQAIEQLALVHEPKAKPKATDVFDARISALVGARGHTDAPCVVSH
jgi:hypothetical protein